MGPFIAGLLMGFFIGGSIFYVYGKKMALDLHEQYTSSRYDQMTCEEAIKYERYGRNG